MITDYTQKVAGGSPLTDFEVERAVEALVDERVSDEDKAAFLVALARKGETWQELAAFAKAFRGLSVPVPVDASVRAEGLLDVVGTGGDRSHTFNISTTAAIVVAGLGVRVAKHGNRAFTSKSGSADVLAALGVAVELSPEQAAASLSEHGFTFLFAPRFHPGFRHVAPARRLCAERGQRTLFNFLGPLLNPARPDRLFVGVPRPELCEPLARVLQGAGVARALVACGETSEPAGGPAPFLDEMSTLGDNTIAEFYHERGFSTSRLGRDAFPAREARLADLAGGDSQANAALTLAILRGEDQGPRREIVLLNAAAALLVAGRVRSLAEGWEEAARGIDSGAALAKLEVLRSFCRSLPRGAGS